MEVHNLYGGAVQLEYHPASHRYYAVVRGRKFSVPSVTTALASIDKPALLYWAVNQAIDAIRPAIAPGVEHAESFLEEVYAQAKKAHTNVRSEAAERGTIVHGVLSGEDPRGYTGELSSIANKVATAQAWLKENNVDFKCTELPIYSRRYRYSGRLDGVGTLVSHPTLRGLSLLDYKTGKGIYPEFRLQMAAYAHAYEEENPQEVIQQYICLHLQEDKVTPHIYSRASLRKDFQAFLAALRVHNRLKEIKQEEKLSRNKKEEGQIE